MPRMIVRRAAFILLSIFFYQFQSIAGQQPASGVRPIDPSGIALPSEHETAGETKFSFVAYGDTRGPADGYIVQPAHRDVLERLLRIIPEQQRAGFPVRFVIQSGD